MQAALPPSGAPPPQDGMYGAAPIPMGGGPPYGGAPPTSMYSGQLPQSQSPQPNYGQNPYGGSGGTGMAAPVTPAYDQPGMAPGGVNSNPFGGYAQEPGSGSSLAGQLPPSSASTAGGGSSNPFEAMAPAPPPNLPSLAGAPEGGGGAPPDFAGGAPEGFPPGGPYGADPWGSAAGGVPPPPPPPAGVGYPGPPPGPPPSQPSDPWNTAGAMGGPPPPPGPPPGQSPYGGGAPNPFAAGGPPEHYGQMLPQQQDPSAAYGMPPPPPQQQPDPHAGALVPSTQPSNPYALQVGPYGGPPPAPYGMPYGQGAPPPPPAPVDPFSVFEKPPEPAPSSSALVPAPPLSDALVVAAPAPVADDDFWGSFAANNASAAPQQTNDGAGGSASDRKKDRSKEDREEEKKGEDGLPPGGEWYDARIFTPTLGVMFFKPQELTDSLFLNTDRSIVDALGERPVVAFIVEGSSARSAGVELGHVLLKVNGVDVKNPKDASRLIKEGPRPLPLLFYVPNTDVVVAEGEHMVKYDTRDTTAPNSAKDWKPKYVVIGGIIAQPWMMNMYRSKVSRLN